MKSPLANGGKGLTFTVIAGGQLPRAWVEGAAACGVRRDPGICQETAAGATKAVVNVPSVNHACFNHTTTEE